MTEAPKPSNERMVAGLPPVARRWRFKKRVLAAFATVCVFMWLVTEFIGAPQVRRAALAAMPITSAFKEVHRDAPQRVASRVYFCTAVANAPFLVRADYGWHAGGENGGGSSVVYLWIFGAVLRLHAFENWEE